jgi:hypothetical protein
LKKIYDFNHQPEHWDLKPVLFYRKRKRKNVNTWGGGRARRLLHAAYVLSFLCLLRVDEVLKIGMHHIEIISDTKIKLTLPFRKTHQFGRKPGILHRVVIIFSEWTWYRHQAILLAHAGRRPGPPLPHSSISGVGKSQRHQGWISLSQNMVW